MPVHKHIRRVREGKGSGSSSNGSTSGSSRATISEDSSLDGTMQASSKQPPQEKYPVGTLVKKYFNGHGWCSGEVILASKGSYKVRYEYGFPSAASIVPRAKDYSYSEEDMPRLTKTAKVELGSRVDIYWPREKRYYTATVQKERPRKRENFLIAYDTKNAAEREWIDLGRHRFKVLPKQKQAPHPQEVVVPKQPDESDQDLKISAMEPPLSETDEKPGIVRRNTSNSSGETKSDALSENDRVGAISPQPISSVPQSSSHQKDRPAGLSTGDIGGETGPAALVDQSDTPKSQESYASSAFSAVVPYRPDIKNSDKSPAIRAVSDDTGSIQATSKPCEPEKAGGGASSGAPLDEKLSAKTSQDDETLPANQHGEEDDDDKDAGDDSDTDGAKEHGEHTADDEEGVIFDPENDEGTRSLISSLVDVGSRVAVYWEDDQSYYFGNVTDRRFSGKPFYISYDDGDEEWIDLRKHKFKLIRSGSSTKDSDVARRNRRPTRANDEDSKKMPSPVRQSRQQRASSGGEGRSAGQSGRLSDMVVDVALGTNKRKKHSKEAEEDISESDEEKDDVVNKKYVRSNKTKRTKTEPQSDDGDESVADVESEESDDDDNTDRSRGKVSAVNNDDEIEKITVGSRIGVWWSGDKKFYPCTVTKKRDRKKPFYVVYDDGDLEEWIDFRKQQFKLLPHAPPEKKKRGRPKKEENIGRPEDVSRIKVGTRVAVWWSSDSQYYDGTVTEKRKGDRPFFIEYDGDEPGHWIDFTKHTFKFLGRSSRASSPVKKKKKVARQTKKATQPVEPEATDQTSEITVGTRVDVYWEGDSKYYTGVVTRERPNSKKRHYLEYDDGEAAHWIDFKEHWVRVLPPTKSTESKKKGNSKAEKSKKKSTVRRRPKKMNGKNNELSKIKVGSRVSVWWPADKCYYDGTVIREGAQNTRFFFEYDDGEKEWINFRSHTFRLLDDEDAAASKSEGEAAESDGEAVLEDTDDGDDQKISEAEQSDDDDASSDEEDHLAFTDFVYGQVDSVGVGTNLAIWWPSEKKYFDGVVKKIDDSRKPYYVEYADGDTEWTDLKRRYFRFLD